MKQIKIKKLNKDAKIPTRGSEYAAGYDLYSCDRYEIAPHGTVKVGTGLSFELPENTFGAIFARSGLATKKGLRPANCTGVCDCDYRGEYIVEMQTIDKHERIAQLVLMPYIPMEFIESDELSETERGTGGFGSTGVK